MSNTYILPHARLSHYDLKAWKTVDFKTYRLNKTAKPQFDMHLPFELGIVLDGSIRRYIESRYYKLSRGGVWLAGMLEPHGAQILEDDTKLAVFIAFPDFFYQTNFVSVDNTLWQRPFNISSDYLHLLIDEEFAILTERLMRLLGDENDPTTKDAQIQLSFLEILLHIDRANSFKSEIKLHKTDNMISLRPAFELIYSQRRPIEISEAAGHCELSIAHFSKLFVQVTRLSFSKFSLRHRLNQVAYELVNSKCTLDELSDKWGFSSKSHLLRRFKEYYNVTPATYRKLNN